MPRKNTETISKYQEYSESIVNTVREPLIVLDQDLRVVTASRSFYEVFKVKPEETVGQLIYALGNKQWNTPKLRELLETILPQKTTFDNYEVEHDFAGIGRRIMLLNARQIQRVFGKERIILLAIEDITDRKKAEDELRQRTAELESSNKELEAFSYSVSHDLRTPLRSMAGFSTALLEDYSERLDEDGKLYLRKIQDSSELMGQIMDDLLKLSRVTRSEINFEKVNLSDLAKTLVSELQQEEPERKGKVIIAEGMNVRGDRNLLSLVLQNLLGNAWKYTGRTAAPEIEMGVTDNKGKQAYFIRDNGVGFNMEYVDKLFKPFQRLHMAHEFPGTGIGLATVQRIIRRHGGEVWAEGKVGEGATFYFTLN